MRNSSSFVTFQLFPSVSFVTLIALFSTPVLLGDNKAAFGTGNNATSFPKLQYFGSSLRFSFGTFSCRNSQLKRHDCMVRRRYGRGDRKRTLFYDFLKKFCGIYFGQPHTLLRDGILGHIFCCSWRCDLSFGICI